MKLEFDWIEALNVFTAGVIQGLGLLVAIMLPFAVLLLFTRKPTGIAGMTPEQRSERSRKAAATKKARKAGA